jgi:nucleotide-binding universal stress UspA family protein
MPVWRRICCGVDLSDPSRAAMRDAAELARTSSAELTIVHVFSPPNLSVDQLAVTAEEIVRSITSSLEAELEPWRAEAARLAERPVSLAVVSGRPADEIVRFARERGFDLIVVATHGRTGVRRFVLGSVAERVVREATVPVLVVRQRAE